MKRLIFNPIYGIEVSLMKIISWFKKNWIMFVSAALTLYYIEIDLLSSISMGICTIVSIINYLSNSE